MIRLIALDLDDTLLRSDLTISYRTKKTVQKAIAAGISVVLASGRTPAAMEKFVKTLGMDKRNGYLICSNGTLIMKSATNTIVHGVKLPVETALTAYDLCSAEGFAVQLYEHDIMYVSKTNEFTMYDQKLTGLKQVVAEDFRGLVAKGCYKLLIPGDPMILQPLESILHTYLGESITLFTSKPYFLEILPPETNKGTALEIVSQKLGIPREEVAAVGDSMNDESMVRWAGLGIAMKNGDKRIKEIAGMVSDKTNDDDGVAIVIEKLMMYNNKA
ncbi:MAG: Cof-type HAD-IIB family hydrolase [Treponema sp.]|jgi:Cof subfamily protein (haloacid dehalogenase superfamily)|nr:Cof-type HAD-IIB family hydrolase [Treponema sp.]